MNVLELHNTRINKATVHHLWQIPWCFDRDVGNRFYNPFECLNIFFHLHYILSTTIANQSRAIILMKKTNCFYL